MRIFTTFKEAFNEVRRDLAEMGIDVHTKTMQDKNIEGNDDYATKELQFYSYKVLNPKADEVKDYLKDPAWAEAEWQERVRGIHGDPVNPGEAYKLRPVWDQFLHDDKFAYTYPERFAHFNQVEKVIDAINRDNMTRQAYISVWDPKDSQWLGTAHNRVPCSLGYLFQYRQGKLAMEYKMRSCDFAEHFKNDVFLACKLHDYVCAHTKLPKGDFIHSMTSIHIYKKDIADVY